MAGTTTNSPISQMNQQEILSDILNEEKTLIKQYAGDVTESSSQSLRALLFSMMTECSQDQFAVFSQMRSRNMYETTTAQHSDVTTAQQNIQTLKTQSGI